MSEVCRVTFEELAVDPYACLPRLHAARGPVWAPNLEMWLLADHGLIVEVLRRPDDFCNDSPASLIRQTFGSQMLSADGEKQRRFKGASLPPFSGRVVRSSWAPAIRRLCSTLLEETEQQLPCDLMASYAAPLALQTMRLVIGLPGADLGRVHAWYSSFASSLANFAGDEEVAARGQEAARQMRDFLRSLLQKADTESSERESVETLIEHYASEAGTMRCEEQVANLLITLFGGLETTESMIGNALWCLFTCEGVAAAVLAAEEREVAIAALVEESLRFEPAVQTLTRHVHRAVDLAGVRLPRGAVLQCLISGANRDPAVFEDADRFDLWRSNARRHLAFGHGTHFCLGAELARTETRAAIAEVLRRYDELRFDMEESRPPFGHEFRKPERLVVEWNRRATIEEKT